LYSHRGAIEVEHLLLVVADEDAIRRAVLGGAAGLHEGAGEHDRAPDRIDLAADGEGAEGMARQQIAPVLPWTMN
jgi:hypothetical protein